MRLLEFRVFHISKKERENEKYNDAFFNETTQRQQKYGMDMLILMQKAVSGKR
jgi:hypothetical protein